MKTTKFILAILIGFMFLSPAQAKEKDKKIVIKFPTIEINNLFMNDTIEYIIFDLIDAFLSVECEAQIEDWMLNELLETEAEPQIEDWMFDDNYYSEAEPQIEDWMLTELITEDPPIFEDWMFKELK